LFIENYFEESKKATVGFDLSLLLIKCMWHCWYFLFLLCISADIEKIPFAASQTHDAQKKRLRACCKRKLLP